LHAALHDARPDLLALVALRGERAVAAWLDHG
jgi:hypothetical protein